MHKTAVHIVKKVGARAQDEQIGFACVRWGNIKNVYLFIKLNIITNKEKYTCERQEECHDEYMCISQIINKQMYGESEREMCNCCVCVCVLQNYCSSQEQKLNKL